MTSIAQVAELINNILALQLAQVSLVHDVGRPEQVMEVCRQDYCLGYIFGFCDGTLQKSTLPVSSAEATFPDWMVLTVVFASTFGESDGKNLMNRAVEGVHLREISIMEGVKDGGVDAVRFAANGQPAMALWKHIIERLGL